MSSTSLPAGLGICVLDTTVLADALLKPYGPATRAIQAMQQFNRVLLPAYAIKELKQGVLQKYMYTHNKLEVTKSYTKTLGAVQRLHGQQIRRKNTALEALQAAKAASPILTNQDLVNAYGPIDLDESLADLHKLSLRRLILSAWKKRRDLCDEVICELECYEEVPPYIRRGTFNWDPLDCDKNRGKCSASVCMIMSSRRLIHMINDISNAQIPSTGENKKRLSTLKKANARFNLSEKECRTLGDAVFVCVAPDEATILTTNKRDHEDLSRRVNIAVATPDEVLKLIEKAGPGSNDD